MGRFGAEHMISIGGGLGLFSAGFPFLHPPRQWRSPPSDVTPYFWIQETCESFVSKNKV